MWVRAALSAMGKRAIQEPLFEVEVILAARVSERDDVEEDPPIKKRGRPKKKQKQETPKADWVSPIHPRQAFQFVQPDTLIYRSTS